MHVIQATLADSLPNPYLSPPPDVPIIQAELVTDKPKLGSLPIIAVGFVLLLVGYLSSNVFAIADLYQVGFGPDGQVIASPFASFLGDTPAAQWLFYAVCASAAIGGCILIGSQNFNPLIGVIFVMCPLVGLVFLVATPLRIARKHVVPVAAVYLMIGTCLAGTGISRMIALYGQAGLNFEPILASLMLEIGLAMLAGTMLKLARTPQEQPAASAA